MKERDKLRSTDRLFGVNHGEAVPGSFPLGSTACWLPRSRVPGWQSGETKTEDVAFIVGQAVGSHGILGSIPEGSSLLPPPYTSPQRRPAVRQEALSAPVLLAFCAALAVFTGQQRPVCCGVPGTNHTLLVDTRGTSSFL